MAAKSPNGARIVLTLLALVLIAVMVRLGMWQLDRSGFKQQRQQMLDERIQLAPVGLTGELMDPRQWQYYRVNVRGRYLAGREFLVDNVVNQGVVGVSVITPLEIAGSQTLVLVDRGWQRWGQDRTFLPDVDTPDGPVQLSGLLAPAVEDHFYLEDPDESTERKQLWPQLDLQRFTRTTKQPVQPFILILDADQPGSYEHIWQAPGDSWIMRHKAYALQWFGLALALLAINAILLYQSFKPRGKA